MPPVPPAQPVQAAPPGWYTMPDGNAGWWDGYRWLAQPPAGAGSLSSVPYRPVAVAGALAQATMALIAAVSLLLLLANLRRRLLFDDAVGAPGSVTIDQLTGADALVTLFAVGYLGAVVLAAVAVSIWCYRVHANLEGPLGARGLDFSPGWAAGWWVVPFANLVMTRRVVAEAWKASGPEYPRATMEWRSSSVPVIINLWWACFVLSGVIGRIGVSVDADASPGASAFRTSTTIAMVSSGFAVVGALLALAVFRSVTQRHLARAAALGLADT